MKRLPDLDELSLNLIHAATESLGIRRTRAHTQACAKLQIAFREAMRAVLPPDDPRRDPAYPFNQESRP